MVAVSAMEHVGIPIDVELFNLLRDNWSDIQDQLIAEIDKDYGVYEGRTFKADRFEDFLNREGIPWERLESGRLKLDDDTFRQAAKTCPIISPLRELRSSMSSMRLAGLAVGESGRNRTLLSPFSSITGRNQPSNSRYAFGPSTWLRGLIKPPRGWGVSYIDWSAAEIGIAAALSKDPMMLRDYLEGDVYLDLGIAAGVVPPGATKATHGSQRDMLKPCGLGLVYTMGPETLAARLEGHVEFPRLIARDLWRAHHERYKAFWAWSDKNQDHAMAFGWLQTVFGWRMLPILVLKENRELNGSYMFCRVEPFYPSHWKPDKRIPRPF